jgi:hypothetical protein
MIDSQPDREEQIEGVVEKPLHEPAPRFRIAPLLGGSGDGGGGCFCRRKGSTSPNRLRVVQVRASPNRLRVVRVRASPNRLRVVRVRAVGFERPRALDDIGRRRLHGAKLHRDGGDGRGRLAYRFGHRRDLADQEAAAHHASEAENGAQQDALRGGVAYEEGYQADEGRPHRAMGARCRDVDRGGVIVLRASVVHRIGWWWWWWWWCTGWRASVCWRCLLL